MSVAVRVAGLFFAGFLATHPLPCAADPIADDGAGAAARRALAALRGKVGCPAGPTEDQASRRPHRGRDALEVTGLQSGAGGGGGVRDTAVFDLALGRIVSYRCLANASTRRAGEAILSMSEVSSRADKLAPALVPGANLALESVRRLREGELESVYYEARFAPPPGDFPFLEPPVRLLLNASDGGLYGVDIDPDWLDPPPHPRELLKRAAAERIASVVLRERDLAATFGQGAAVGRVAAADLFTVRPNDWLGLHAGGPDERSRVAWLVNFWIAGGDAGGPHALFIDAASGRALGGMPAARPSR